jgi:hypothetical protein
VIGGPRNSPKIFTNASAGVVNERVDAPEPSYALGDPALSHLPIRQFAGHGQNVSVIDG